MTLRGVAQWLDDKLNPIVVKELRQAVQSKFVVVVLLLFLVVQLLIVGIYLAVNSGSRGAIGSLEQQAGRDLFSIIQGIMLAVCMVFIPLYTGIRLGAERSDSNVDLLFVTTLPPRAIISGKILASLTLAVVIFSSVTPYLFFTYLLRGIDWPSIWMVVFVDFVAIIAGTHLAVFLAVIPGHWFFKAIIGLLGLAALVILFSGAMSITIELLFSSGAAFIDAPFFLYAVTFALTGVFGVCAMFYSWSVALLSPASANRALIPRVVFFLFWLVSLAVCFGWNYAGTGVMANEPMTCFVWGLGLLCCLQMVIAINERESWSPRTARTIPRQWWLRMPAFLFYSGAAGGVIFSCALFALTIWISTMSSRLFVIVPQGNFNTWDALSFSIPVVLIIGLYVYCYAMTAVLFRRSVPQYVSSLFTWVVFVILVAVGCFLPTISMLILWDEWNYRTHYPWLVTIPFVAIDVLTDRRGRPEPELFWITTIGWAIGITLLNLPWFIAQFRAFRPYQSVSSSLAKMERLPQLTEEQAAVTRTLG